MIKIYDISLTIAPEMPTWPGDPKLVLERVNKMEEGANANVTRLDMGVHTGTHIDAPYHFVMEGGTVEHVPLDVLIGPAQVITMPDSLSTIHRKDLEQIGVPAGTTRLLIKTRNSRLWGEHVNEFDTSFVALEPDAAQYLVDRGVKFVGIDYLSIAPFKRSKETHQILLRANVVILEGANLWQVPSGEYQMYCLPLKLAKTDGAPARVILITE
ncbi:MAG: cyclase family protein [Anaerolineae bacterium]|nr:cyclase family protein [Anaerolineae bacterium]